MKKTNTSMVQKLVFVAIALGIVLLVGILVKARRAQISQVTNTDKSTNLTSPSLFPIDPNNPHVSLLLLSYSLNGTVEEVKKTQNGAVLRLRADSRLPSLPLNNNTQVVYINVAKNGAQEDRPISSLKKGMNVNVGAFYNAKNKQWTVPRVTIFSQATIILSPTLKSPR